MSGLPATLLTTFGPPMVNMAIFTLIYPLVSSSAAKLTIATHSGAPVSSSRDAHTSSVRTRL